MQVLRCGSAGISLAAWASCHRKWGSVGSTIYGADREPIWHNRQDLMREGHNEAQTLPGGGGRTSSEGAQQAYNCCATARAEQAAT